MNKKVIIVALVSLVAIFIILYIAFIPVQTPVSKELSVLCKVPRIGEPDGPCIGRGRNIKTIRAQTYGNSSDVILRNISLGYKEKLNITKDSL